MVNFSRLAVLSPIIAGAFAAPAPTTEVVDAAAGRAVNYNQNYIASGASVTYSPQESAGSFSVNYNTHSDFVVGLGWQPGDKDPINFSGSFSATGVGLLSVYGWSTNPLVEYYIMEQSNGYQKVGTQKGTVTSDGSTYEIWEHQQTNQPSIKGTTTFQQYISIRQTPRSNGTVTVQNHFDAWAAAGMKLGAFDYQVVAVESWSGSGKGQITLSKGASNDTQA